VRECSECVVPAWANPVMDGLVRGPWKRRTDHFAPLVHAPKKTISLCSWPFLAMKTLSHHGRPIHQNVGLLFSFSNPSEF
jgi:hypothetical protein